MDPAQLSDAQLDAAIAQAQAAQQPATSPPSLGAAPAPADTAPAASFTPAQQAYAASTGQTPDATTAGQSPQNPYYDSPTGDPTRVGDASVTHVSPNGSVSIPASQPGGSINTGLGHLSEADLDAAISNARAKASPLLDMAQQIPVGLGQAVAGVAGLPGNLFDLNDWVGGKIGEGLGALTGKPYVDSKTSGRNVLPGVTIPDSNDINNAIQNAAGERYPAAQTLPGAVTRTAVSFLPAAASPGTAAMKAANVVLPALGSEGLGQLTKGTPLEAPARFVGGLLGMGGLAAGQNLLSDTSQIASRAAAGVTPEQLAAGQNILKNSYAVGAPVTAPEALQQATAGATGLGRLQRLVESTKRGDTAMAPFFAARPGQVRQAVSNYADTIAPASTQPGMVGQAAQSAAQTALDQASQLRSAALQDSLAGASAADPAPAVGTLDGLLQSPAAQQNSVSGPLAAIRPKLYQDDAGMTPAAQAQYESAMTNSFGSSALRPTQEAMSEARDRLGSTFDRIAGKTSIPLDDALRGGLQGIINDAGQVLPSSEMGPLHAQVGNILGFAPKAAEAPTTVTINGQEVSVATLPPNVQAAIAPPPPPPTTLSGETYQALTRKGAPLDRAMSSTDPNVKFYAGQIRDTLDDALERAADPADLTDLRTARTQYRNMKIVQDASNKTQPGQMIEPSALLASVRKATPNFAYTGGGDLGDAAQGGLAAQARPASLQTDPGQLLGVRNEVNGLLAQRSGLSATDPSVTSLQGVRGALDGVLSGAAPDYAPALAGQAGVDARLVAPLQAGPIGKIAATSELPSQAGALYPKSPTEGASAETGQASRVLNSVDPTALPQLTRSHIMDTLNGIRDNQGGPSMWNGAKFAAKIAGNPEQASALNAGVSELPSGAGGAQQLQDLLDVFKAQGKREAIGSRTAFNADDLNHFEHTQVGNAISRVADPLEWGHAIGDLLGKAAYMRRVDGLSKFMTSPDALDNFVPGQTLGHGPLSSLGVLLPSSNQPRISGPGR